MKRELTPAFESIKPAFASLRDFESMMFQDVYMITPLLDICSAVVWFIVPTNYLGFFIFVANNINLSLAQVAILPNLER
jgi:hypothetical protein